MSAAELHVPVAVPIVHQERLDRRAFRFSTTSVWNSTSCRWHCFCITLAEFSRTFRPHTAVLEASDDVGDSYRNCRDFFVMRIKKILMNSTGHVGALVVLVANGAGTFDVFVATFSSRECSERKKTYKHLKCKK